MKVFETAVTNGPDNYRDNPFDLFLYPFCLVVLIVALDHS
jgi:hypothetical protein